MLLEKQTLSMEELEDQAALELPNRDMMLVTVIITNLLNNLSLDVDVQEQQGRGSGVRNRRCARYDHSCAHELRHRSVAAPRKQELRFWKWRASARRFSFETLSRRDVDLSP